MDRKGNLFILNFGNDEFDSCRFYMHPQAKSIEEFESDRLDGDVPEEVVEDEDIDVYEFAAQLARLRMKGYVEVNQVIYCHVTDGYTEEL